MGASGVGNGFSVSMSGVDTVIHTPLPPTASCGTCAFFMWDMEFTSIVVRVQGSGMGVLSWILGVHQEAKISPWVV